MASHGIRDRVAIVGMGCTTFGEHWDRSTDDLLIDASSDALASAGVALDEQPVHPLRFAAKPVGQLDARPQ